MSNTNTNIPFWGSNTICLCFYTAAGYDIYVHADDDANDAGTSTSDDDEFVSADATVFHAMSVIDYGSCKYSRFATSEKGKKQH